jgi:predicted ArsR family transcriptional regulator
MEQPCMQDRTVDRLLYALKSRGPQTAAQLAKRFRITPVAVRQLLVRLTSDGLVQHEDRREGVGRPKRHWCLTAAGHARFPDNHAELTTELLDSIGAIFGDEGMEQLIRHREEATLASYRQALAPVKGLFARIARLAKLRSAEGYMAEVVKAGDAILLVENHCPICVAASRCQSFCRSELAIFRDVLGPAVKVERLEHMVQGARRCVYRIDARR